MSSMKLMPRQQKNLVENSFVKNGTPVTLTIELKQFESELGSWIRQLIENIKAKANQPGMRIAGAPSAGDSGSPGVSGVCQTDASYLGPQGIFLGM